MDSSDSNNNVNDDDDDEHDESSSEFSFNECDITLIDDDDLFCDAKNDGELLYCQVVEMLRFEVEVCAHSKYKHFFSAFLSSYVRYSGKINKCFGEEKNVMINYLCLQKS